MVIDGTCQLDGNPEWVSFESGYPPDWDQRSEECRPGAMGKGAACAHLRNGYTFTT